MPSASASVDVRALLQRDANGFDVAGLDGVDDRRAGREGDRRRQDHHRRSSQDFPHGSSSRAHYATSNRAVLMPNDLASDPYLFARSSRKFAIGVSFGATMC